MKKLILLLPFVIISCKQAQKGEVNVVNGSGATVSVKYQIPIFKYDEFVEKVDKQTFNSITDKASSESKMKCKYMDSYEPKDISYNISGDTATVLLIFNAKNAYGVADSKMSVCKFIKDNLISSN
jgi:hypothetical protein